MMKRSITLFFVPLLLFLASMSMFAQEKTLQYYNTHESEILPDAQAAFRRGEYERTIELCRWHYIIFGNNTADSLRDKSERCAQLTKEMNDLRSEGNVKDAKMKASAILSLNPDDTAAKETLLIEEPTPPAPDTAVVEPPIVEQIEEIVMPPAEESPIEVIEETAEPVQTPIEEIPSVPVVEEPEHALVADVQLEPHTRFVVKAGASIIDLKQASQTIAPGGSVGAYDLAGSRVGGEIGAYACPGLSASSVSLIGFDAALVIRASKSIYPKLGAGYFSCKTTDENTSTTTGMCAIAGLNLLLGNHLCLEFGAKYFPETFVHGSEVVTATPGARYEFPNAKQILSGGVAPFVSLGWAF